MIIHNYNLYLFKWCSYAYVNTTNVISILNNHINNVYLISMDNGISEIGTYRNNNSTLTQ